MSPVFFAVLSTTFSAVLLATLLATFLAAIWPALPVPAALVPAVRGRGGQR